MILDALTYFGIGAAAGVIVFVVKHVLLGRRRNKFREQVETAMRFLSEPEITDDMFSKLSEKDKEELLSITDPRTLIQFHHTTGRAIRNRYKLWEPDNPYTNVNDGIHPNHPDNMSQRIIETIWKRVHAADQATLMLAGQ